MATTVYGREGDDFIITRINFGHGDEYLVERREGAGYLTIYSGFTYEKALTILKRRQECDRMMNERRNYYES